MMTERTRFVVALAGAVPFWLAGVGLAHLIGDLAIIIVWPLAFLYGWFILGAWVDGEL